MSRIIVSDALHVQKLVEIPVTIDWLKKRHGVRLDWQGFCDYAGQLLEHEPVVGIMLHHQCMPSDDLEDLDALLKLLMRAPGVSFTSMANASHVPQ